MPVYIPLPKGRGLDGKIDKEVAPQFTRGFETFRYRDGHEFRRGSERIREVRSRRFYNFNDDPDKNPVPLFSDEPHPADYLIFQERVQMVRDAILSCAFTAEVRTILDMRLSDQPYAAIAEKVGMETREVLNILARAVRQIRKVLTAQKRL